MKKLIVTDPVWIWSDLTSGTSDEKRECMGYDSEGYFLFLLPHDKADILREIKSLFSILLEWMIPLLLS